jgi:acetyl-CoA carboxylase biotin carboxylase subunit
LAAAEITHADAIHPGYGFLAENAEFSRICQDNGFVFIGPTAEIINAMGNKSEAKKIMKSCGVPVIPGSNDVLNDVGEARNLAEKVGYPLMIKASAGGGGRGMRLVKSQDELESAFGSAQAEAKSAFNNGDLYLEKFVENSRHIEVQILADSSGNTVHLGERECTIQRRHQKLIEESPSVIVDGDLRKKLGTSAINAAKTVKYVGVGTVEFLVDKNLNYFFMEMNTRIQVEHPVTEMVSGVDLIKQQIRMHVGKSFPSFLEKFQLRGHAIECRINAEDPANDFVPSPMEITSFHMPGGKGVRVDSHAYAGYQIPTYYDSMIGKLIVFSSSRERAIIRMERALEECIIEGPKTTIPFHQAIMRDEQFISGNFDTSFLDNFHYSVAD